MERCLVRSSNLHFRFHSIDDALYDLLDTVYILAVDRPRGAWDAGLKITFVDYLVSAIDNLRKCTSKDSASLLTAAGAAPWCVTISFHSSIGDTILMPSAISSGN